MIDTIQACTLGTGGAGIFGGLAGPGADLPVIAATWIGMTVALADQAGHRLSRQTAKKITLAVAAGIGSFVTGTKIATAAVGWLTAAFTGGLSLFLTVGANVSLNSALTYAYGRAASRYFLETDDIDDVEVMVAALVALMCNDLGYKS